MFMILKSHLNRRIQITRISDKAAINLHIAQIHVLESQHGDPNHPQNVINCPLYHCRAILKFSFKSVHNLLRNGKISDWAVSMVIWIATII